MDDNATGGSPGDCSLEQWLARLVGESARLAKLGDLLDDIDDFAAAKRDRQIPPDQLEYLRQLIKVLLDGRRIVAAYNYVMLLLLAVFTALHLLEKRRCWKRWQMRMLASSTTVDGEIKADDDMPETIFSSSSSSSPGITTPSGAVKDVAQADLERLPLLGPRHQHDETSLWARTKNCLAYWLEYQPRPLPVINRTLPSNATSIFVGVWVGINVFFHIYQVRLLYLNFFFCFADRAGLVFIVNLPLLYLLAAKNQPLNVLTGRSYEALNVFHRRVGEWMCFEALVHFASMVIWRFAIEPAWLTGADNAWSYFTHPLVLLGIGAFVAYELLYCTSLGSLRQRWYEIFLASHVVLQVIALGFLYLHFHTARPYVLASLAIFLVDRVVWRFGLKSTTMTTDLTVLPDGETIVMSANWEKSASNNSWFPWPRQSIKHGWKPTDHVFLTVPALGRKHALQAHPFTIASAAPQSQRQSGADREQPTHCWMNLLIRSQEGFTTDLLCYAHRHHRVSVRLDGPYGSSHALEMLRAADSAVLVAGGSGIAVTFPLVWALLMGERADEGGHGQIRAQKGTKWKQKVRMMWIVHSDEHRYWVPSSMLDELVAAGLDLVVPPSTAVAGRPDVIGAFESWDEEDNDCMSRDRETAVVVSGPDGLNRMVRNACAEAIGRGRNVQLAVEKFGW
ncbi:hypothetical protein diail_7210 [Diaporthe ilicicola]|nr:hypothetical protein diail_7210 [Diaporthe ilicicola]